MKDIIKKYWMHIINILFLVYYGGVYAFINITKDYNISAHFNPAFMVLLAIGLVAGILVEIIYCMVKAISCEGLKYKALRVIGIWFFNIFYAPMFYIKHICKDEKHKLKNIIYFCLIVVLYLFFTVQVVTFTVNATRDLAVEKNIPISSRATNTITEERVFYSDDDVIKIKLPVEFKKETVGEYDMFFTNSDINVGLFLYDGEGYTRENVLTYQVNYILKTRDNCETILKDEKSKNGKTITTQVYKGEYKGEKHIYSMSAISFDEKKDYVVYVVEIARGDNYKKYEEQFNSILDAIEPIYVKQN